MHSAEKSGVRTDIKNFLISLATFLPKKLLADIWFKKSSSPLRPFKNIKINTPIAQSELELGSRGVSVRSNLEWISDVRRFKPIMIHRIYISSFQAA